MIEMHLKHLKFVISIVFLDGIFGDFINKHELLSLSHQNQKKNFTCLNGTTIVWIIIVLRIKALLWLNKWNRNYFIHGAKQQLAI